MHQRLVEVFDAGTISLRELETRLDATLSLTIGGRHDRALSMPPHGGRG